MPANQSAALQRMLENLDEMSTSSATSSIDELQLPGISEEADDDESLGSSKKGNKLRSQENKKEDDREVLGQRETNHVFRLRIAVFLVILAAAAAVSTAIFIISSNAEEEEFEVQFRAAALKVIDSFHSIIGQKVDAIGALAVAYTSAGIQSDLGWPRVTMKDFAPSATTARQNSDSLFLAVLPIVSEEQRVEYEAYVADNLNFVEESLAYQEIEGMIKEMEADGHGGHGGHGGSKKEERDQ